MPDSAQVAPYQARTPGDSRPRIDRQYVHGDALALTDAAGAVVGGNQVRYDAYGRPRSGSVSSLAADEAYTGQKRDATGLSAFPARVYDPSLNQWIQPDTIDQIQPTPKVSIATVSPATILYATLTKTGIADR